MTRIVFFEPSYVPENVRDWEIRGSYKYPSLLGDLYEKAEIRFLMATLPPVQDTHRRRLETEFGVSFHKIDSLEDSRWPAARILCEDYDAAIAEHAPDIVSTLNGRMIGYNYALARAARGARVDFVYRIAGHDIATQIAVQEAEGRPVEGTSLWGTLMAQESYAAEAARTVIVMGATERDRVAGMVTGADKVRICRRGVDRAHFSPAENPPECCARLLFVGRDSAEKGVDLVEAAADLLAKTHPVIRFTIAGDFAEREIGNRRYLGFHGYDQLPDLYRDHDALVLPARSEGFPQVVMEAMSCGLPTVLSRHLFARDFAEEGEGAALVPLEPGAIADPIAAWHDDPERFREAREHALAHAAVHFDERVNRPLYHDALLGSGDVASADRAPISIAPMRRYWIVSQPALAALDALIDPPHWGPSGVPLTVFITDPRQRDAFEAAGGGFELIDASKGLVTALLARLESEPARYVQIAVDPIEDFPAAAELLAGRLAGSADRVVRTAWLGIGSDQSWSTTVGEFEPIWMEIVALREALSELDGAAGVSAVCELCTRLRPADIVSPNIAGAMVRSAGEKAEPAGEPTTRARLAGGAARMDWREVRVRVRLDRAAAQVARAERERKHRTSALHGDPGKSRASLGWAARMRAKLTGWLR